MRSVEVTIPISGYACMTLEVDDDATDDDILLIASEKWEGEFESLEMYKNICTGNVCNVEYPDFTIDSDEKI